MYVIGQASPAAKQKRLTGAEAADALHVVSYDAQTLTEAERQQVRENIKAVSYEAQTLTAPEQQQACENIRAGNLDVANTWTQNDSFLGGISFGSATSPGDDPVNLSRHVALWGGTFGFSITTNTLNYVTAGRHDWYQGAVLRLRLDGSNLLVDGTQAVWHDGNAPAKLAALPVGSVGTYALLQQTVNQTTVAGQTVAGADLRYSDAENLSVGGAPAGTWECCGQANSNSGPDATTVWKRVL